MNKSKGSNFIKGAITLSVAGLIAKLMGFSYRIVLPRIIGAEGVGLYQLAYPIYTSLLVISTSGLPVALAKLISDRIAKKEHRSAFMIFKVGRRISVIMGICLSLLMIFLARPIINIFQWDSRVIYSVVAIAPAIFFVSIMSTYRGFFQGLQDMAPTAYSQVIEQFIRIVSMVILVYLLLPYGIEMAAAGATFGAVTGAAAGLLILIYIYFRRREKIWDFVNTGSIVDFNSWEIAKKIVYLAVPVTFGALILPLMSFVDAAIVPTRLQTAGFNNSLELYGQLSGMALVLVRLPTMFTIALATSLVPAISEAFAINNEQLIKSRTESALRLAVLIGLPASVGLFILAKPLTTVIFGNAKAAVPLRFVSWGVLFIALKQTTSAVLQGLGKPIVSARNLLVGAVFNAIINYTLTALPQFGIRGAALGTVTGFAIAAFLNIYYAKKHIKFELNFMQIFIKPLLAVGIMAFFVLKGFDLMQKIYGSFFDQYYILSTFSAVFIGAGVYLFLLLLLQEIKYSDIVLIPKIGKKIADVLFDFGLVKK
ncbi:MAG: putative polysaccharide biosynthesis protein [Bacillota bacterium]